MSSTDSFIKNNLHHKINYHDGLFLKAKDFQVEQNYHQNNRWLQNAILRSPGVVLGLFLKKDPNGKLFISAGLALDKVAVRSSSALFFSREIILSHDLNITNPILNNDGIYRVELQYNSIKDEDFILQDQSDEEIYMKSDVTVHLETSPSQNQAGIITRIPIGTVKVLNGNFTIENTPRLLSKWNDVGSTFTTVTIINSLRNLIGSITSKNNSQANSLSVFWLHIQNQLYNNNQLGGVEIDGMVMIGKVIEPKNNLTNNQQNPKKKVVTAIDGDVFVNGVVYAHDQIGIDKLPQTHLNDINNHFKMGVRKFPSSGGGGSGGPRHEYYPAEHQTKDYKGRSVKAEDTVKEMFETPVPFDEQVNIPPSSAFPSSRTIGAVNVVVDAEARAADWRKFLVDPENIGLPFVFNTQTEKMSSLDSPTTLTKDHQIVYIDYIDEKNKRFRIATEGVVSLSQTGMNKLFNGEIPEANAMYTIAKTLDESDLPKIYFQKFNFDPAAGVSQFEKVVGIALPDYEIDPNTNLVKMSNSKISNNFHYVDNQKNLASKINALLAVQNANYANHQVLYGVEHQLNNLIDSKIETVGVVKAVTDIKDTLIKLLDFIRLGDDVPPDIHLDHLRTF